MTPPFSSTYEEPPIYVNAHFTIEPCSTCSIPGYLIVVPTCLIDSLCHMTPAALASLGPTLAMGTRAIEAVVHPQRVYCALFSEQTHSVHFHLFPRTEWLAAKYVASNPHDTKISGPLLLDWARRVFQPPASVPERDVTIQKIRDYLSAA